MKKKMNNKGFTLVELIVVLVILAILAAILVPALLGYIDRAKKQQIVLNAKTYLTATQAELSSLYGAGVGKNAFESRKTQIQNTADVPACTEFKVKTKAELPTEGTDGKATIDYKDGTNHDSYTVVAASYTEGGQTIYFANGSWDATSGEYSSATGSELQVR